MRADSLDLEVSDRRLPRMETMETCPICESAKTIRHFDSTDRLHGTPGTYCYDRCLHCRSIFQNPRIVTEDLPLIYPVHYYTHTPPTGTVTELLPDVSQAPFLSRLRGSLRKGVIESVRNRPTAGFLGRISRMIARSRLLRERAFWGLVPDELLPRDLDRVRALEIGCGTGRLLNALHRIGWEIEGVERDEEAAKIARRISDRPVAVGDFQPQFWPQSAYDLIVMHHVFEHMPEPRMLLRRLASMLAPGGRIVMIYPNPSSLAARLYGENWFPWEVPRHLNFPSKKGLQRAVAGTLLRLASFRTSAGLAARFISLSRSYLHQKKFDVFLLLPDRTERMLAFFEKALVSAGFHVGEETIAVLMLKDLNTKTS